MDLQQLYQRIGLAPDAVQALDQAGRTIGRLQTAPLLDRLMGPQTAQAAYRQLRTLLGEDPDGFKLLYCYLECARRAHDGYQRLGIPDEIYTETMKCFPRFLAEYRQERGALAFDRGWWAYRQTSLQLFRIGALEYEFALLKGVPALALHIPSDANLSAQEVDRSLVQAEVFFKTCFPDFSFEHYTCDSWLLSPRLRPLLAQNSRILAFQNRFRLLEDRPDDREFIQWLFQAPQDTPPEALPCRTSLQRQVKRLLLQGGSIGCTFGVLTAPPAPR